MTFVVNDDVDAAIASARTACTSVSPTRAPSARSPRVCSSASPRRPREAAVAEYAGAGYIGAGPVWATPSKPDAAPAIGLDGLREICQAVSVPVVAIGGVDAGTSRLHRAGAAGVACPRAAAAR